MRKRTRNKIWDSKLFYFIIALFASFFLWVYISSTESIEIEETFSGVPLVFSGEDTLKDMRGLIVTETSDTAVSVRLRGSRSAISKLKELSDELTAVIDISGVTEPVNNRTTYTLSYPDGFDASGITVVSRSPLIVEYYIDKESSRSVEVQGKFIGTIAEGYIASPLEIDPLTVKISGPEKVIDQVAYAYFEINRQDVDSTLQMTASYTLMDEDGNEIVDDSIVLETETVNVTLPIRATSTVDLAVDIVAGGGATSENVFVSIDPAQITIVGDAEILAGINKIVLGTIDLSQVDGVYEDTYQISLDNGVESLSGETQATVSVEIRGLETKEFTVTNLSCINVPDGYSAEIATKSLKVKIRADEETLDAISATNIRAVADLTDYEEASGGMNVPVKIYIADYSEAGAVGSYSIYVTLTED